MASLDGLKLVEFGSHLGSACAAWLLAEQGAKVIKIEPPGGDPLRGTPHFHVLNRSKSSLFLDSAGPAGREEIARLTRWADLFVTGFVPSELRALRIDYQSLSAINPHLVAVNVPPLGSNGPHAEFAASDDLVAAFGGVTGSQWARSGDPVALTIPAVSYSAGILAATAAVSALIACDGGPGQSAEVSLLAGALSLQTGAVVRHTQASALTAPGAGDPLGPIPCYRLYEAADGRYLFVACGNPTFWGKFALALERPELVADPRFEHAPWGIPADHRETLKEIIGPIIRTKPRAEWLQILREHDVPCAPVRSRQEFIAWQQTRALGMVQQLEDPELGRTTQLGLPLFFGATPGCTRGPAPRLGDESGARALLSENAPPPATLASEKLSRHARGPLDGVMVLDFSSYIAGSYGPMILAQLGAQVIKVESLEGDSFRHFGFGFLGWNAGKRGLSLNLGSAEGREIVYDLVEKADVLVENLRSGRMKRFGLDYPALAARNPRLIYMSVTAFGNRGPEHEQPGFDPLLQAHSGVMAAQGGHDAHPVYLTAAICDYGAAMLSALGCVIALRARQRTGRGQFCETSLLQAAMAMQAGEFNFYQGRPDLENGSPERRGSSALARAYQCREGEWLFISLARAADWEALRIILTSLPSLAWHEASSAGADGELAAALAGEFAELARDQALAKLRAAAIPATAVRKIRDLFDDPQVTANELLMELPHSQWGAVRQTGLLAKFSATPAKVDRAAPLLGEHTDQILREYLSLDQAQIDSLRSRQIIK
ncbi:MAG TPA: CoA transferase [Candidatus Binataceae bacterium]|nr:CoA transferase [Candidatus Binataceae bacterium]